jgi:peptidoglycan/LPS O-acetylase OafA/YrhL
MQEAAAEDSATLKSPRPEATLYTLQACRAAACLLVALYHGAATVGHWYGLKPLGNLTSFGFSGVHLFFVISGMIIFHAHYMDIGHISNAWNYLRKRLVRIYPFYWIVFLVAGGWKVLTSRVETGDFVANALVFSSSKPLVVAVAWTLAYEMLFYGMFMAFIFSRRLGIAVFATWFALTAVNLIYPFSNLIAFDLINVLFMAGLVTSAAIMALRRRLSLMLLDRLGSIGLLAGSAIFIATAAWYVALDDPGLDVWRNVSLNVGFGAASALMLFATTSRKIENFFKRRRLFMLIGDASYAIYLVHLNLQAIIGKGLIRIDWIRNGEKNQTIALLFLVVVVLGSVALGIVIHKFVEKPVLTLFRGWLKIGRTPLSGTALASR